ncbi:MAG TPA: hypothetical protein VGK02_01570 [Candidatus Aquicultor sp.]
MKSSRFIEVKISKATLFLTPEEFKTALKRGKAILRARSLKKRIEDARP